MTGKLTVLVSLMVFCGSAMAQNPDRYAQVKMVGKQHPLHPFVNGTAVFMNREYAWENVPSSLRDWKFTKLQAGREDVKLSVKVEKWGTVFIGNTLANRALLEKQGWKMMRALEYSYTDKSHTTMTMYMKAFRAGETVQIPQVGWTGTMLFIPPERLVNARR